MFLHYRLKQFALNVMCTALLSVSHFSTAASAETSAQAGVKEAPSRFAKLEGMRVRYRDSGKGGRDALVFVHGWTCNLNFWRMQFPAFDAKTRVVALDLPGHGESDKPQIAYTMELFARAVDAVLRDAGVKRAVLVGHSMGVPVVRQFYRKYPEKTLALVNVDGAFRPFARGAEWEKFVAPMRGPNYKEVAGKMIEGMMPPHQPAALKNEIKTAMFATPQHVAVSAFAAMGDDAIWTDDQIKVPALAVLARNPFWPADNEARFRQVAPDLDYRMWDGVSHFLMMDKPQEFNETLAAFLTSKRLLLPQK